MRPFDVHARLCGMRSRWPARRSSAKEIRLSLGLERPAVPWSRATRCGLKQVFWNMIKNAAKFTPKSAAASRVETSASADDPDELEIRVTDTGIGMTPERARRGYSSAFSQGDHATRLGATVSAAWAGPGDLAGDGKAPPGLHQRHERGPRPGNDRSSSSCRSSRRAPTPTRRPGSREPGPRRRPDPRTEAPLRRDTTRRGSRLDLQCAGDLLTRRNYVVTAAPASPRRAPRRRRASSTSSSPTSGCRTATATSS